MNLRSLPRWCGAFVLLFSLASPVMAQVESREGIALQNQILQLQQQVQQLQAQRGGGTPTYLGQPGVGAPPPSGGGDLVAQLLARVGALEEQVRQLRGRIDQTENDVQRQGADLGKRIDDLAFQTGHAPAVPPNAATPGTAPPPGAAPTQPPGSAALPLTPPPGPAQPPGSVKRTPELAMQEGNAALARRDYPAAEQAAHEVLTNYRTSPRAYDAQFLLAQSLAGERQFSQAAIAYDDTYNRAHKGAHAADALVGLANSLAAINEKKAACDTIGKLHTEFPNPRPDLREAAATTAQRAGCH
jgi:TolA-binding protein